MPTTHTCLPHIPDSHQPSGLLGYANLISMVDTERAAVCMEKFTDSYCWMNSSCLCCWTLQHTTLDTATQRALNHWCRGEMSIYLSYQNNTIWSYEALDVMTLHVDSLNYWSQRPQSSNSTPSTACNLRPNKYKNFHKHLVFILRGGSGNTCSEEGKKDKCKTKEQTS